MKHIKPQIQDIKHIATSLFKKKIQIKRFLYYHFKNKWIFSLILFSSIFTLPLSECFAVCYYLSLFKSKQYSTISYCCNVVSWSKYELVFNKALHNPFFTEKSSLENPFQKHQRWSSLLISFGHVKKRKKRCWEKETKNSVGKIHDKQLKEGPWDKCRHQCPTFFF